MRYLSVGVYVIAFTICLDLRADQIATKQFRILGKTVSATQNLAVLKDTVADDFSDSGVESTSSVTLFGKKIEVVKSSLKYKVSEDDGIIFEDKFYIKGRKVLGHSLVNGDGSYAYGVDVPATEIAGDLFSYSLGILSLGVYSGVSYEGSLKAEVRSELLRKNPAITADMNLASAEVEVDLLTKGFIEGQVRVLFIRGSVGGAINLIDGQAGASIGVTPQTVTKPNIAYQGVVSLLSGSLYGYVGSGNSRWLSADFYKHKGFCYAFGASSCQN
jgi:hypothetical protein